MTTKEALELNLRQLEVIANQILQSTNLELTQKQVEKARKHYNAIEEILITHEPALQPTTLDYYVRESKLLLEKILDYLETTKTYKSVKMPANTNSTANESFDSRTAASIISIYDLSAEKLDDFVTSVEFIMETTPATTHGTLLKKNLQDCLEQPRKLSQETSPA